MTDHPQAENAADGGLLVEAALRYAERGWPILPCQPDKKPIGLLVPNGLLDATTDPARIGKWWRSEPEALIGGATGEGAMKIVLDVDVKAGVDGYATLAELEAKHGPLPETVTATTPSGGRHYYFRHPGRPVKSGAEVYGPGLDSRADGAYAILPPSAVTDVGAYAWLEGHGPDDIELAPAPDWVTHPQAVEAEAKPSGSLLSSLLREPPGEGGRHTWLTRVAGCYASSAADHATYAELVRTTNQSLPEPLPETEVEGIVSGIWAKQEAKQDEPPAWETPIPFDSFDPVGYKYSIAPVRTMILGTAGA